MVETAMLGCRTGRRSTIWAALFAATLTTLWPIVEVQNGVADALAAESGAAHDHTAAPDHAEGAAVHDHHEQNGSDPQHSHCGFCSTAAVNAILAPFDMAGALGCLDIGSAPPLLLASAQHIPHLESRIHARAPPVFS